MVCKPYGDDNYHQSLTLADLSCAGEQEAIILDKMRELMVIVSL